MKKIFGNFKSIRLRTLLFAVPITLAYPVVKALLSPPNRALILSDTLFIISLILIALGVLLALIRHGDFDITRYVFQRGIDKSTKPFEHFKKDVEEERNESFNYPLFFGLVYFALSLSIAWIFC